MSGFSAFSLLASFVLLATFSGARGQTYTVVNNCPSAIDLYISSGPPPVDLGVGAGFDSTLAPGAQVVKTGLGPNPGHFWTTANNGIRGAYKVATAAGFRMNPNEWFYYILKPENHNDFNTGISITPSVPEVDNFCSVASCEDGHCSGTFYGPGSPSYLYDPPILPTDPARPPPIYQCKTPGVDFLITFCPSGQWPSPAGEPLRNNYKVEKCLDVEGGIMANGTPVHIYDCNGSAGQSWVYHRGTGQVKIKGSNFCLDSGPDPVNGSQMKIWECYDDLPAQTWTLTGDDRFVRAGTSLCLDLTDGSRANGNIIQTWTCSDFSPNQIWSKWYCLNCD